MNEVDWTFVAEAFADALERPSAERADFVRVRCAGRPAELEAVERMLAADRSAEPAFLAGLDPAQVETAIRESEEHIERIGPWRIVREIGRGGMGRVFLGERTDGQFDQHVAIKLVKRGMDSDAILARFLRERRILAGLDHPNIARLIDGGLATDGRPYFVMEYVDGLPITAFADARRLTIDERLRMFREVCDAVSYAHRNLVVHRDLKPSNVMVTEDGRVKLLDFGVAKLLSADDGSDVTTLTTRGVRPLTPAYAAPEQIHGGPITTSTDVFGLGTVLYELLSGRRPFDADPDRLRLRPDTEPAPPSAALTRIAEGRPDASTADAIAATRSSDPIRLRRRLAGDLDTIVATALRAAPERRYPSPDALADDLQRHAQRLPLRARPDTFGYRVSRFVGRHRYSVMAATAASMLVVAFAITATVQARALGLERTRAQREAATAREVSEFLVSVFEVADPMTAGLSDTIRAADLLDRGARRIETALAGQPDVQARLLTVIGRAYDNLRMADRAQPLLEHALDIVRASDGPESPAAVSALQQLASVQSLRGEDATAEASLREAMAIQEGIDASSGRMWSLVVDLAVAIHRSGDYQRGNEVVAQALELSRGLDVDELAQANATRAQMAGLLGFSRNSPEQDSVFARLLEAERAASGNRSVGVATMLLAWKSAVERRDPVEAEPLIAEAVEILEAMDSTSLLTADALSQYATLARRLGDFTRSDSLHARAIGILVSRLGEDHLQVATARLSHSRQLVLAGRLNEAMATLQRAIPTLRRESDPLLAVAEFNLGVTLRDTGRLEEADSAFRRSLDEYEARYPPDYILAANTRSAYGETLVRLDRPAAAEPMLRRAIEVLGKRWGENDVRVDGPRVWLARAIAGLGRPDQAAALLREVLSRRTAPGANSDPDRQAAELARQSLEALRSR